MTTYLDPREYCPNVNLSDVLILVPTYRGPDARASASYAGFQSAGAEMVVSSGLSDVALHRCSVATKAIDRLASEKERSGPPLRYVLWLDDDTIASVHHVEFLKRTVDALGAACTAYYCKRGNSKTLAMQEVERPRKLVSVFLPESDRTISFDASPVLSGMGCLMLSVEQFVVHCASVPHVGKMPVVCTSGPVLVGEGKVRWCSEDFDYCEGLWSKSEGVYAVPIAVGHLSSIALLPSPDARMLDSTVADCG